MKIRSKATIIMLSFILAVTSISCWINYLTNQKLIETAMHSDLHTISTMIQVDIDNQASTAAALASLVASDPAVQALLRARDREGLIKLIVPPFLILKDKYGVIDGHFHIPPATSFLRTYKTATYGDDLSKIREIIVAAQKQQRPLQGIEISSTGVSIKGVDVIKDAQGFIGTVEVGESLGNVLETIKKITGFEAAAFVNNAKMEKITTNAAPVDKERIIGGYRNVFSTNWDVIRNVATPTLLNTVNDVTYQVGEMHGQFNGLVIVPLLDFKGEQIGSLWAVGDFTNYQKELRSNLILSIAFALFQSLVLSAIVLVIFTASYLLPIQNLAEKVQELSETKGGEEEKIDAAMIPWMGRRDEVGTIAHSIQKLNQTLKDLRGKKTSGDK